MRRKKKSNRGVTILIILALAITMGLVAHSKTEQEKAYKFTDVGIWVVEEGDTLWKIADFHSNNTHDIRQVIYIIEELNPDLTTNIYPRQLIEVPLFNNMDWEYYEEQGE